MTVGKHHWADGTRVAGQQFEFGFDDIGNRQSAIHGGNASGSNLRVETYTANSVNQYTQRTVPGFAELQGQARADATVTVNVQPTERYGPYWRYEHAVNNSTGAVQQTLGIVGVLQGAGPNGTDVVATNSTSIFLPQTPETFTHDADGNLIRDGRWNYSWDAENRLTSFTSLTNLPAASRRKLDCAYDPHIRRTRKVSSLWNGYAHVTQTTNHFVYDGWNLVAQFDGGGQLEKSFLWGTDLSGTPQGAGGVGGLTAMTLHQGAYAGTYLYYYDGRGNVAALVSATTGEEMARYEYGPFGELLRASGPLAFLNPFRFSTKFCDDETGFYYYGYRYYDPSVGRWLSRDPMEEGDGPNIYGFTHNTPVNLIDILGRESWGAYYDKNGNWAYPHGLPNPNTGPSRYVPSPNFPTEMVGWTDWHYTRHTLRFKWNRCCDSSILADQIYNDLKQFNRWSPNSYADANLIILPGGNRGVAFGTPGWPGVGMDLIANQDWFSRDDSDTNPVLVSLFADDVRRTVTARTLGRHMLVGARKWSVNYREEGDFCVFTIHTYAIEKARNLRNEVGARTPFGRTAQANIWEEYLNNVVRPHRGSACFISGDNTAVFDTNLTIDHNPYLR